MYILTTFVLTCLYCYCNASAIASTVNSTHKRRERTVHETTLFSGNPFLLISGTWSLSLKPLPKSKVAKWDKDCCQRGSLVKRTFNKTHASVANLCINVEHNYTYFFIYIPICVCVGEGYDLKIKYWLKKQLHLISYHRE